MNIADLQTFQKGEDRLCNCSSMSELQRSFAKAKLAALPFEPPVPLGELPSKYGHDDDLAEVNDDEQDDGLGPLPEQVDDDSSSASSASSASSTGTIKPSPSKHLFARPRGDKASSAKKSTEPLPWNDCFKQELYLHNEKPSETVIHHVYLTEPQSNGPLLVAHHGAGSSGLSFALFASEIRKLNPKYGILSLDARGHGETTVKGDSAADEDPNMLLNLSRLSEDLVDALRLIREKLGWSEYPDLVLIGHSLGGAVVTDVAKSGQLGRAILGYAVIDVVEGSAIDALQSMQQYSSTRPSRFTSIPAAIEWHTRSRTIRSSLSARVSVPSLLRLAQQESSPSDTPSSNTTSPRTWLWRTDLSKTQPYWSEWFTDLSSKFLAATGAKLLILAGTDRLDKTLIIGQMQGRYALQILPEAGHFVQEDCAAKTASIVEEFVKRNERGALVLPKKVGELQKQAQAKTPDAMRLDAG